MVYVTAQGRNQRLADVMLVDAWTGLRWSELRAIRVRDFVEVPMPILVVQRAEPEGVALKVTKSRKTRRVPVADRFFRWSANSLPVETLTLPLPHRVRSSPPRISIQANTGLVGHADGRRIHDLRHTAACLWLARGVDPVTVQAWMGHASIATTNLYLHHLGTAADGPDWPV